MVRRTFVLTLALALLAPATASAQWQPPTSLTGDVPSVSDPDVLFAARGDKIVGYGVNGRSAYSRTLPGQDAPFHQRVTTTSDGSARLLTYASEHVMLVSQTAGALVSDLRAQFGTVGGGVGSVKRIAPGHDAARYDAAINSNGEAAVAYIRLGRGERGPTRKSPSPGGRGGGAAPSPNAGARWCAGRRAARSGSRRSSSAMAGRSRSRPRSRRT